MVLRHDPNNVKALFRRGSAHLLLGDLDEAIEDFKSGLLIDPTNSELKKAFKDALARKNDENETSKRIFSRILNKNIYEDRSSCQYSDSLNPVINISLS